MGQTLAYHKDELDYTFQDLMFIVDAQGNLIPWTKDKKTFVKFVNLTNELGYLITLDELTTDPKNPVLGRSNAIKPVIHTEREHPVPGED